MSKIPMPTGPSEIFRRMQPASKEIREIPHKKPPRVLRKLIAAIDPNGAALNSMTHPLGNGEVPVDVNPASVLTEELSREEIEARIGRPLTKAEKVKAWRAANPELYAAQKQRTAERQAKKRAEKDKAI